MWIFSQRYDGMGEFCEVVSQPELLHKLPIICHWPRQVLKLGQLFFGEGGFPRPFRPEFVVSSDQGAKSTALWEASTAVAEASVRPNCFWIFADLLTYQFFSDAFFCGIESYHVVSEFHLHPPRADPMIKHHNKTYQSLALPLSTNLWSKLRKSISISLSLYILCLLQNYIYI